MNKKHFGIYIWFAVFGIPSLVWGSDPLRAQSVALNKGWNAVFLEVDPVEPKPDDLFDGVPVDIVARYFTLVTPVQFISDPADEPWKTEGWGVWYAADRGDAFLTSLHAIQGNQCYLVHATEATSWEVTGAVRVRRAGWRTGSFNLFGACLDESAPPTFGTDFSGTGGKIGSRIYRLVEGKWAKVDRPEATPMRPGEACWIYCSGKTDYQGPIDVTAPRSSGVDFGTKTEELEIAVRNVLPDPVEVSVEAVSPPGESMPLPLNLVVRNLSELETRYPVVTAPLVVPSVAPGSEARFKFQLRRDRMTAGEQSTLLKISSSSGVVVWLPVSASDPRSASSN